MVPGCFRSPANSKSRKAGSSCNGARCWGTAVLWVDLCFPKIYAQVLVPGTCKCDWIWERSLCKYN